MEEAPPHKLLTLLAQLTLFSLLSLPTLKKRWHAGFHMSMTFPNLCTYPTEKFSICAFREHDPRVLAWGRSTNYFACSKYFVTQTCSPLCF